MKQLLIIFLFAATQVSAQMPKHPPRSVTTSTGGVTYATLDPAKNSTYCTLSGGNLTATDNSGHSQSWVTLSTVGYAIPSSGTRHCEFTIIDAGSNIKFGIATTATSLNSQPIDNDAFCWTLKPDGYWVNNGGFTNINAGFGTGTVVGMDVNLATGVTSFTINGTATSTTPAFTLPSGTYYAAVGMYFSDGPITVNFGATAFTSNPGGNPGWY